MNIRSLRLGAACAAGVVVLAAAALAQNAGSGTGSGSGSGADTGMGPGMMMGQGMMGPGMMMGRGGMGMMGGCPMMGGMMGQMGGRGARMGMYAEGRAAFLKAELAITEAQQPAWTAYSEALRKNLSGMQSMHQTMMQSWDAKSAVERLNAHIAAMEGRLTTLKDVKAPLEALYAVLSDEQKKKADDLITGMGCMM